MKKFWKIAGIVTLVAVLGVTAVGAVAFAQDAEDGADWPFNFRERFTEAIAGVLGISVEEYDAAVDTAQGQVLDEAVAEGWLTEEQAEQVRERVAEGFGPGTRGGMRGGKFGPMHGGHGGFMGGPENSLVGVAADQLDMTVEELLEALDGETSIADVATEQGVEPQAIADAHLAQIAERLDEAVAEGYLTQERADWMLEQATERVQECLYEPFEFEGPCHGGGFRGGPGRMRPGGNFRGFPNQNDA